MTTRAKYLKAYRAALTALVREAENLLDEVQHPGWEQGIETANVIAVKQQTVAMNEVLAELIGYRTLLAQNRGGER